MLTVVPLEHNSAQGMTDDEAYRLAVGSVLRKDPHSDAVEKLLSLRENSLIQFTTRALRGLSGGFLDVFLDLMSETINDPGTFVTKLLADKNFVIGLTRALVSAQDLRLRDLPQLEALTMNDPKLESLSASHGRFQLNTVYRVHPAQDELYLPFASFHDYLLDEKSAEFVRLAAALGAKRVRLAESKSQSAEASARAGVDTPLGDDAVDVGVEAGGAQRSSGEFEINLESSEPPVNEPSLPDNLYWMSQEPLWQAMVEARLNSWATDYRVRFRYTSDFNVNASVAAKVESIGLSLGGSFETMKRVEQEYHVEFWPRSSYTTVGAV